MQEDYDISNANGAQIRADLNATLEAIATNNSGTSPPTTTYPYMFWADHGAANKLRIRNGDDTFWIEVGSLDSPNLGLMLQSVFSQVTGGVTASHTDINKLTNMNTTTTELNLLHGMTELLSNDHGHPIGSIYMNATNSDNPSTLLGFGSWSFFGEGRVLVAVKSDDTAFNSIGKTGGYKTDSHVLSKSEMPSHNHVINQYTHYSSMKNNDPASLAAGYTKYGSTADSDTIVQDTGGNNAHTHDILQPYITVYMWVRDS